MQNMRIVYARPDGGVSVVHPAWRDQREGESDVDFLARVERLAVPPGMPVLRLRETDLPAYDSTTRDRWRIEGGRVVIGLAPEPVVRPPVPSVADDLLARLTAAEERAVRAEAKVDAIVASIRAGAEQRGGV